MKLKNFLFVFVLFIAVQAKAQQPSLLPQFTFFKLDGKAFSNKDMKQGKQNLFILFDCTCEHCQREAKVLKENYTQFKNINIYMVTLDEAYIVPQFFTSYAPGLDAKANVTVLQDRNKTFIPAFLPSKYPAMYLYSPTGKLLVYNSGDGGIKAVLKSVKK
ncbi:TlpA family protein disulfide reductase [Pedobacter nototheniae]|uniref:TlpA family protein disulfide reductase n=1 Tax=Pedobacter nototheniae TaxID=2488994 RepID=UPI00292EF836|nr:redoxin domain-containing protein [Pedobacter nototheniae]